MSIDIERLKVDREYWDEVAPEGAEYYCRAQGAFLPAWYKYSGKGVLCSLGKSDGWDASDSRRDMKKAIPRPQAQEAEWVDGVPPVGAECEFKYLELGKWVDAKVIGYDGPACVVAIDGYGYQGSKSPADFRPIPTPVQRQRDELKEIIRVAYLDGASTHIGGLVAITDAILSRYTLEPKP